MERFPAEGRVALLNITPRNGTNLATTYAGLFVSQDELTVPSDNMVLATGGGTSPLVEAVGTAYARKAIVAGDWGVPAAAGGGTRVTASQQTFVQAGSGGWGVGEVNGFFIATTATPGTGICLFVANFDDLTGVPIAQNDIFKLTPFWGLLE